jgi:HK97 family phage portal protein
MLVMNGTAPAFRDANTWKVFMGITEENQDQYNLLADYASAPADEAWVHACVNRLIEAAQSVPLRVYQYQSDGLDLMPVMGTDNQAGKDLQHLLDWVNPVDMNGSDLKAYTIASWAIWGGCYWMKVRGKLGGPPQELFWLPAPSVRYDAPDGRMVLQYHYTPKSGIATDIAPKDIVAFRSVNLASPLDLVSPLSAARNDMTVQREASIHTAATIRNWSVPPGAWIPAKGTEITSQDKGIIERMMARLRGPHNAGRVPILPIEMQWVPLAMHPQDAEWLQARRVSRMTVCAVLGVPLVLAGDDEKLTTYASLRDARKIFWEDTVVPKLNWIADVINGWLVPDFDPSGVTKVAFDYSTVVALKEPMSVEKNIALSEVLNQVRTPDEYRSQFRIGKKLKGGMGNRVLPKTTVTLRPDPSADPALLATLFPAMNVNSGVKNPQSTAELFQPGMSQGDYFDLPADLRTPETVAGPGGAPAAMSAYGKHLYQQQAVRAFVKFGGPLDVEALGFTEEDRQVIEDGLRRRKSAAQIAAALGESHA